MVPGMTERERLAADVRRLEWLADARFGPATVAAPPLPDRLVSLLARWRRRLTAAFVFGKRVPALPERPRPEHVPVLTR